MYKYRADSLGEIGNGRAAAILLARHGAKVALVDYNVEWAQETKRMIDEEGGLSEVIQADVTSEDSCKNAVDKTIELWGSLHILVNIGTDHSSCPSRGLYPIIFCC
jgi:NAD(P)-dependent dehydrogenase (short-subunit alcohol dehydrogenase family)